MTEQTAVEYDEDNNHPAAGTFYNRACEEGLDHYPAEDDQNPNIAVTVYHGVKDGKPVLQIDTTGHNVDFRINVNDCTVYDSGTDSGEFELVLNSAKDHVKTLRREAKIHVGSSREDLFAHIAQLEAALGKLA